LVRVVWRKRTGLLAALAALMLSGCASETVTKTGRETANLYNIVLVMATIVFVAVEAAIIWQVVKYRKRRNAVTGLPPQIHGNRQIEILWTALPSVVIAALFVMSMKVLYDVNAEPTSQLTVQVVGYQWQWTFNYLDKDGKTIVSEGAKGQQGPTLYLPTNREIHFEEVSNDVIHSFFVPAFFFKRDVVPGRTNTFNLMVDRAGTFVGECAEFCGDFHNEMTFTVRSMPGPQFDSWLNKQAAQQAKGPQCTPSGPNVQVSAKNIHFDTDCLAAPANQPFTITFDNQDPGVDHNVEVYSKPPAKGGKRLAGASGASDFFPGVATKVYKSAPLKAGRYWFQCDVHPTAMFGTFIVK
jgi:cytochrome c oxidase subunit 2